VGIPLTPREVVQSYLAAFAAGDIDTIARHVTDDFVNEHTSALGESVIGRDAYRSRLVDFLGRFTDLHYESEAIIADGDEVAVPYRMTANWLADDGRSMPLSIRGMFRFVVRDEHIARRVDYWDSTEFVRQTMAAK